nr:MAG: hypothetical protein [Erysiphe necator associated ourmia-like virus 59]
MPHFRQRKGHRYGPSETPKGGRTTSRCSCRRIEHQVAEAISRFLKIVRVRFSLPMGELPNLEVAELDKYLLYLLNEGCQRPSCQFPRVQAGWQAGLPVLNRLGRRQRWEFAHTLASLKKGLKSEICKLHPPMTRKNEWFANACRDDPPSSSTEYLQFVRKETRKIFRIGWDSTYDSFCSSFVPKRSSRAPIQSDSGKWWSQFSWEQFQGFLRGGRHPFESGDRFTLRYKEVPTVGKVRPMGIPDFCWDLLGPLHKTMYQYIASKEWCLRGPPTEKRVSRLCHDKACMTSVDLVSATDGLRVDVAEAILGVVLAKSAHIPGRIRELAVQSLRPTCEGKELTFGQNMGTYLSFPLLCLQSYLAARWATRGLKASIMINGDDCLIASSRFIYPEDYPEGFRLNDKKIIRSNRAAEINSTVFLKVPNGWREVKNVRRGAAYPGVDGLIHLSAVLKEAGKRWLESAFESRVISGVLPSQLGVDVGATPKLWAQEERAKRYGYRLIEPIPLPETRFEKMHSEPTTGDSFAFHKDLFEGAREKTKMRPRQWGPTVEGRRSKLRRGVPSRCLLSSIPFGKAKLYRKESLPKERTYCYSAKYEAVQFYDRFCMKEGDGGVELRWLPAFP